MRVPAFEPKKRPRRPCLDLLCICVALGIAGCSQAPAGGDEEHFMWNATKAPVDRLLATAAHQFGASWRSRALNLGGAEPAKMYMMEVAGATVVLTPLRSDRCDPNGRQLATFGQAYQVDLTYHTPSQAARESARRRLLDAARKAGQPLAEAAEC